MKRKMLTLEEQLRRVKKRFAITVSVLSLLILAAALYIYLNYDYLAFKHFITQNYIYTDALDALYQKELKTDVKGRYYTYFDDVVISTVTQRIRELNNDRYTYLYTPEKLQTYLQEEKTEAQQSEVRPLNDNTVYLHLTNFSVHTQKFMKDNIVTLRKYPYIIIDLRDNYGGDSDVLTYIAGLFLPRGSVVSTDSMRLFDWVYKTRSSKPLNYNKIIILQNKNSASASENFIAALKDNLSNVLLIGDVTYGKGIGQFTLPLKRGYAVKATILKWYTPKGINIQGQGIQPDIPYTSEDILQFALRKLQE